MAAASENPSINLPTGKLPSQPAEAPPPAFAEKHYKQRRKNTEKLLSGAWLIKAPEQEET